MMTCYSPNMRAEATCSKPENSCQSHAKVMPKSCEESFLHHVEIHPPPKKRIFPRNACEINTKNTPQQRWKNKAGDHPCLFTLPRPISIHHFLGVTHRLKKRLNLQQTPRTSTLVSVCLGGIGKTIWGMIINYRSLSANTLPPLQFHVHIYI